MFDGVALIHCNARERTASDWPSYRVIYSRNRQSPWCEKSFLLISKVHSFHCWLIFRLGFVWCLSLAYLSFHLLLFFMAIFDSFSIIIQQIISLLVRLYNILFFIIYGWLSFFDIWRPLYLFDKRSLNNDFIVFWFLEVVVLRSILQNGIGLCVMRLSFLFADPFPRVQILRFEGIIWQFKVGDNACFGSIAILLLDLTKFLFIKATH